MLSAILAMPEESLWGLVGIGAIAAAILGVVTNAVLRERGFGMIPNGILMLVGFMAGVWTRYTIFGSL